MKNNRMSIGGAIIGTVAAAIFAAAIIGAAVFIVPVMGVAAIIGALTVIAALGSAFAIAGFIATIIITWQFLTSLPGMIWRGICAVPGLIKRLVLGTIEGVKQQTVKLGLFCWPYLEKFGEFIWPYLRPVVVSFGRAAWRFIRGAGKLLAQTAIRLDSIGWIHKLVGGPLKKAYDAIPWTMLWQEGSPFWIYNPDATEPVQDKKDKAWAWWLLGTAIFWLIVNIESGVVYTSLLGGIAKSWDSHLSVIFWTCFWTIAAVALQQYAIAQGNGQRTTLSLFWRKWLTARGANWLYDDTGKMYGAVTQNPKLKTRLPNFDYTLVQDNNDFPNIWPNLCYAFGEAGLKLASFGILLLTVNWILSTVAIAWVVLSNIVVPYLGRRLGELASAQFDEESELRRMAGRARTDAEAIALGRGEKVALTLLLQKMARVWMVWMDTMRVNRRLQFFQGTWVNIIFPVVAFLIAGILGHVPYGEVIQAAGYFTGFYQAANVYADQFGNIENLRQVLRRLCTFEDIAKECIQDAKTGKHIQVVPSSSGGLEFRGVTVLRPGSDDKLWDNLTWSQPQGSFTLWIAPDPQAQGLSTMVRTIIGYQNAGEGEIGRPHSTMVLAVKGDTFASTMRRFLSDPLPELITDDAKLMRALTLVGLDRLIERPDIGGLDGLVGASEGQPLQKDWLADDISKTERQKLFEARILVHEPDCVLVDAAGLNGEDERIMYANLRGKPNRTVFTAGFPSSMLLAIHDFVGILLPEGKWEAPVPVEEFRKKHPELLGTQAPAAAEDKKPTT
jgi:ABC-type uncharacterized transport system fused permease/ATPase subunit